jgi:quercetin dioxygenase-like cupin family protein
MSDWVNMAQGIKRRIVVDGANLMMVEVHFEPGAIGALHNHVHEQITTVQRGRVRFHLDGTDHILSAGERIYIASNLMHSAAALEEGCELVDTFSPPREDFR